MFENQFSFTITNGSAAAVTVALLAGLLSTLGFAITQAADTPFAVSAIAQNESLKTALTGAGITVDAVADDGTIMTDVTIASNEANKTYRHFKEYVKFVPQFLRQLTIETNNASALSQSMIYKRETPLAVTGAKAISLTKSVGVMQPNDKKTVIQFGTDFNNSVVLGPETALWTKIPANTVVTYYLDMQSV